MNNFKSKIETGSSFFLFVLKWIKIHFENELTTIQNDTKTSHESDIIIIIKEEEKEF